MEFVGAEGGGAGTGGVGLTHVVLRSTAAGTAEGGAGAEQQATTRLEAAAAFVAIGHDPNTAMLKGTGVRLDSGG